MENYVESDDSDVSSVLDPDTADMEDEICDGSDPSLFGSDSEDDECYVSKSGEVKWSQRSPFCDPQAGPTKLDPKFLIELQEVKTPSTAFKVFFDETIISDICRFTNAEGLLDSDFKDVTSDEIWAWISILIAAGKNHDSKINYKDMWSNDEVSSRLFYAAVMGKHRYLF